MRILLIRHGESEADLMNIVEGQADYPLTEHGHRQAEAMARWVAGRYPISAIHHSPLTRAAETAEHLHRLSGAPMLANDRLMEFDNGILAGMSREQANRLYPRQDDTPLYTSVYGQESMLSFRFRVEHALSEIIAHTPKDAVIAIVCHGGTITQLNRALLRLPLDSDLLCSSGDTGIHEWVLDGRIRRLVRANSLEHLQNLP